MAACVARFPPFSPACVFENSTPPTEAARAAAQWRKFLSPPLFNLPARAVNRPVVNAALACFQRDLRPMALVKKRGIRIYPSL